MKKLVIFDLDGTLLNSLSDLAEATNFALEKNGFPTHELCKYNYFVGNGVFKLIERALPEDRRDEETLNTVLSDFKEYYAVHSDDTTNVYDGVKETVCALHDKGIKLAVATNKPDEFAKPLIEEIFGGIFDYVQGSVPELAPKPDPAMALAIMEKLGISPEDALFVGDTNVDIRTGKSAGIETVGCLWGYRTREELEEAGASRIIAKPEELIGLAE